VPSPQEGYYSSLWKREVRRDFINQCTHYFETVNNALLVNNEDLTQCPYILKPVLN